MKKRLIKNSYIVILMSFIMFGLITIKSYAAASYSVSPSKASIKVGGSVSATISANNCGGKFTIVSSDSSIASVSSSKEFAETNKSASFTITGKKAGTAVIAITSEDVSDESEQDIPVTIKNINITVTNSENNTTSEAKYSNVNQKVYARVDTNVRESDSTSSKSLGMLQAGNEVTRIGVGDNGWSKVTYNGKTAYIYSNNLVTTKPEDTKSMDKALKSLKVAEGTLEPEFSPDTTKYSVSVENNIEIATIDALANSDKAKVEITGNEKLVMGSNMVKITVTAE